MDIRQILLVAAAMLVSYLWGSIPSAYLAGKFRKNVDIRDVGSRNAGAMNVFYSVGFISGLIVLGMDIGKGVLAIYCTEQILSIPNQPVTLWQFISGVVVVLGHNFPVWLKFKGGKGGATCIGVLVAMMPWSTPFYLVLFLLLMWITRFPTLSYSLAFIIFPIFAWFVYNQQIALAIYSVAILILPGIRYIPRLQEMYRKGGSWKRVFQRKSLKDRL